MCFQKKIACGAKPLKILPAAQRGGGLKKWPRQEQTRQINKGIIKNKKQIKRTKKQKSLREEGGVSNLSK